LNDVRYALDSGMKADPQVGRKATKRFKMN
jgi:hypothetical protein